VAFDDGYSGSSAAATGSVKLQWDQSAQGGRAYGQQTKQKRQKERSMGAVVPEKEGQKPKKDGDHDPTQDATGQ